MLHRVHPCPGMTWSCFRHVRLACSQCSLNIYHSCVQHSVSCVLHKSQLYMRHCRCSVASTSCLLSARLQTRRLLTRGRTLRAPRFRCFSQLCPKTSSLHSPDVRLPGCLCCMLKSSGDLEHVHAQVEHSHENHRKADMRKIHQQ